MNNDVVYILSFVVMPILIGFAFFISGIALLVGLVRRKRNPQPASTDKKFNRRLMIAVIILAAIVLVANITVSITSGN